MTIHNPYDTLNIDSILRSTCIQSLPVEYVDSDVVIS
jgi:hypothetical protein